MQQPIRRRKQPITVRVNGVERDGLVEPRRCLRLYPRGPWTTGTHVGCEHGICGACTVLVNGAAMRSCLMFAIQADGAELMTVEGLAQGSQMHPLQEAFWENHGLQCGFCTPGVLMAALEFLRDNPNPTEHEVRENAAGNLCRCTGYHGIIKSILAAAEKMRPAADGQPAPAP